MRNTDYVFNKNHRIRIYITSSKYPSYEPNPNNGGPFNNSIVGLGEITYKTKTCITKNRMAICNNEIPKLCL